MNIVKSVCPCILLLCLPLESVCAEVSRPQVSIKHHFKATSTNLWQIVGRFCSIEDWQDLVDDCLIEERSDGIYRVIVMNDSSSYVERLESFSHDKKSFQYSMTSGPVKIQDYQSKLTVIDNGVHSILLWQAWFDTSRSEKNTEKLLKSLFRNGIGGMEKIVYSTNQ